MKKKLTRSSTNRMIAGVLAGVAEYFDTDANLVRLGYLVIVLLTGVMPGIILYIIAAFILPEGEHITPSAPVSEPGTSDDTGTV